MDYNGDGKVEPEEYIKFVKENYVDGLNEKFEEAVQQEAEQFGQYKDQFN